jgi:hypothetical protein
VLAGLLAHFMDGDDMRVPQLGRGLGLGAEAIELFLGRQMLSQHHLEGHGPVQALLPGLVDHPHATAGDFLQQFVVAEGSGESRVESGERRIAGVGLGICP